MWQLSLEGNGSCIEIVNKCFFVSCMLSISPCGDRNVQIEHGNLSVETKHTSDVTMRVYDDSYFKISVNVYSQ